MELHKTLTDKGNKKYGLWALEERIAKEAGVAAASCSGDYQKGGIFMTTYEEFNTILTVALLIVAILNLKNK